MKFSVIMPVNLSNYQFGSFKCASNPEDKFMRAVNSFINQSFQNAELIIVSDGCKISEEIYIKNYVNVPNIYFKYIKKQELFSGIVRQTGIDMASGTIICYLDHDDMFGKEHLAIINKNFDTEKYDWIYYNDLLVKNIEHTLIEERNVSVAQNSIGTSSIAHKRNINVLWKTGYGHDWQMIETNLLKRTSIKIITPQYYVCHCAGYNMDF